jgi:hypothetical protein
VGGWIAILTAPAGSVIAEYYLYPPGNARGVKICSYARKRAGLSVEQADWIFDPWLTREQVLGALMWLPLHQDADHLALAAASGNWK